MHVRVRREMPSHKFSTTNHLKIKIGVGHPLMGRGGSEARTMWTLQALKDDFNVSLISAGEVHINALNRFYGTSIRQDEIFIRKAPLPFFMNKIVGGDALRGAFYQRFCRKIASEFDVLISTYNICDFGIPAIHFIADFSWDDEIRRSFDPPPSGTRGLFHQNKLLRKIYLGLSRIVSNPSGRNVFAGEDLILANSKWSAKMIKHRYGVDVDTLYPPVTTKFPVIPRKDKESGFVCIGRISPEKRVEQIIDILRKVRKRGHDIHLHIIGGTNETSYGRSIEEISKAEKDWIILEGKRFGQDKAKILTQHHFGIHARQAEAFGISIAEMVKAGCITFVPDEGGQTEIVDHSSLIYKSVGDAVDKIDTVLQQPILQNKLQRHLEEQAKEFSVHRFKSGLLSAVEKFMKTMNIVQQ